jgi:hypothetical protein
LPTSVTNQAQEIEACKPDRVELELPDGWSLAMGKPEQELGFLDGFIAGQSGRFYRVGNPGDSIKAAEWIVQTDGTTGTLTVQGLSERAGRTAVEVELG